MSQSTAFNVYLKLELPSWHQQGERKNLSKIVGSTGSRCSNSKCHKKIGYISSFMASSVDRFLFVEEHPLPGFDHGIRNFFDRLNEAKISSSIPCKSFTNLTF